MRFICSGIAVTICIMFLRIEEVMGQLGESGAWSGLWGKVSIYHNKPSFILDTGTGPYGFAMTTGPLQDSIKRNRINDAALTLGGVMGSLMPRMSALGR